MFKSVVLAAILANTLVLSAPLAADPDHGSYLAARQAGFANDFVAAAGYFNNALKADPLNADLLENAMTSYIALGQIDRALPLAQTIVDQGYASPVANLTLGIVDMQAGNWSAIVSALETGRSVGPLVDGLAQAWAAVGQGQMARALTSFDQVIESHGLAAYAMTHKAYALASVGDFEAAEASFDSAIAGGMRHSRLSATAHAQVLGQMGRHADAVALIDTVFVPAPAAEIAAMRDVFMAGDAVAYDALRTPQQAMADLYFAIAGFLQGDAPDAFTLLYARAALHLWPEHTPAVLMAAGLLEDLGQYDLANATYSTVSRDDPSFPEAELGRATVLDRAGRTDTAIEVLDALTRSHPDLPDVYARKGDFLRMSEQFTAASDAYSRALDLYDNDDSRRWFAHYTRAIAQHRLDNWPAAEADFRAALALQPDHPQVLNYLGYSLVERGEKLQEALEMIQTAAAARPDNGAIVDSLGWVLFQLGQYDEAVIHLEHAAALLPFDPVINDHLGDALWAVGRKVEAQFQWQRALSFAPEDEAALRIRDKLNRGLDMVLADEGTALIDIASDND